MHISEGIITGVPDVLYTAGLLCLVGFGAKKMKEMAALHPEKKALFGMAGAFIFFLSLIPIPAFTGTTSHPCGSPLVGILLGPWVGIAITGLTLLLQAAFFAHGGFSTWGANVITLGVGGAFFGWLSFRIARKVGLAGLIAMRPPLILLDEPFAGLDPASTDHLLRLIRHLNSHHHYTFVIVTHDINIASLIAKRVIVLVDGRIIADGPPKDILTNEKLLRDSRLEPPILTQLFQRILDDPSKNDRIPVTIDEAMDILNSLNQNQRFDA